MKTISDLNSKAWYRLLKVLSLIIMLIAGGVAVVISFSDVGSYQNDYTVVCNYGNRSMFLAYKDKGMFIPYGDHSESLAKLPEIVKTQLRSECAITDEELNAKADRIVAGNDDSKKLYDITPTKVIIGTWKTAILWSLLSFTIIFVVFQIIRRAFYYIVLGSIRPKR